METAERRLENIQVLLVDDNADTRYIIQHVLEYHGAIVVAVENGREALATLVEVQAHVIISDLSMPVMDGIAMIEAIRRLPGQGERPTPAIAFTAFPGSEHRRRVFAAGFNAYLVKPVDPDVVIREVARLMSEARSARGVAEPGRDRDIKL
jgi:CheY-like chemotaxis protein